LGLGLGLGVGVRVRVRVRGLGLGLGFGVPVVAGTGGRVVEQSPRRRGGGRRGLLGLGLGLR
jgi:hypothetical protein